MSQELLPRKFGENETGKLLEQFTQYGPRGRWFKIAKMPRDIGSVLGFETEQTFWTESGPVRTIVSNRLHCLRTLPLISQFVPTKNGATNFGLPPARVR